MKRRFLPLAASLLLTIVLVFVVEDFMRQVIVDPLLQVAWFITLVLGSIAQEIYWAIFIVLAFFIARKSLVKGKTLRRGSPTLKTSNQGPVATWSALLERAEEQTFSRWRLAQAFRKLTRDLFSPNENHNLHRPDDWEHVKSTLPPEILDYLESPLPSYRGIVRFWSRRRADRLATVLDLDPEIIVTYLEEKLDPLTGD
jgi:hypothetical protein